MNEAGIEYRPLARRTRWVVISAYGTLGFGVLSIPGILTDTETGWMYILNIQLVSDNAILALFAPLMIFGILFIVNFVAFLLWTYRAARNVRALGANEIPTGPGMAVIWYFIPLLSLWKPYQALRDFWKASHSPTAWQEVELPGYFGIWWAVSVVSSILSSYSLRVSMRGNPEDYESLAYVDFITLPFDIVALWLMIRIVKTVATAQDGNHVERVFE